MSVLIVVGVLWMIVAGTAVIKVRTEERVASVEGFQRQLRSFGGGLPPLSESHAFGPASDSPSIGRAPAIPALQGRLAPHRARRLRRVLAALLMAAALTLFAALVLSSRVAWGLHLLVDNALLAYVALLVRRRDAESPKPGRGDGPRARPSALDEDGEHTEFRVLSPRAGGGPGASMPAMAGAR